MKGGHRGPPLQRQKILVSGIVQGVGFRPFVHGLARRLGLTGLVTNTTDGVTIEVEGKTAALIDFIKALKDEAPPLAQISGLEISSLATVFDHDFVIAQSRPGNTPTTFIPPDVATCADCLSEFFNPGDRRYLYPFINCTNCGPRYTIIENLPYDRRLTTMRNFTMCPDCRAEYEEPTNRRYHAEPNACPICGPVLCLHDATGILLCQGIEATEKTSTLLAKGKIVAIKGLGGFHLAVDAKNEAAVQLLKLRKGRAEKPLAIMVPDLETARKLCFLEPEEEQILLSRERPILLAQSRPDNGLAAAIAPGIHLLGIMLPYTPMHHLLIRNGPSALVMTSGNVSEEPIAINNQEAMSRLSTIADYFLLHNRDIHLRNDDSVVIRMAGHLRFIRRSRGYAPAPIRVARSSRTVLAVGGEIKNTVCLLTGENGIVSQHIGDLENLSAYQSFKAVIDQLITTFKAEPELVVHDLHPGYLSTRWAIEEQARPSLAVQHHHAHLAACLAENRESGPAIGIILDGTGYGADGSIWGGEILVGDCRSFMRYGYLEPMPLAGGETAIREPWRTALGYLYSASGNQLPDLPFLANHNSGPLLEMLAQNINCPITTSCGRLFDAVAAMSGGRQRISYEAQAAIEFSELADNFAALAYPFDLLKTGNSLILGLRSLILAVADDVRAGSSQQEISSRFHLSLNQLFTEAAIQARVDTGINLVALSGGVFQNRFLLTGLTKALSQKGFTVLTHTLLPTNDGCISLGQAVIGRERL